MTPQEREQLEAMREKIAQMFPDSPVVPSEVVKHIRILALCSRAFLRELLSATESSTLAERSFIKTVERSFKLVTGEKAREVALRFGMDWSMVFPAPELVHSKLQSVRNFMEHRFIPAFGSSRNPQK